MRVYGRKNGAWQVVETAADGSNDYVYVTALIQAISLNLGESPFFGDWGIPAKTAIVQQVFPDYNMILTQQRYSQYFASLVIAKRNLPTPVYDINLTTNQGVKAEVSIPA